MPYPPDVAAELSGASLRQLSYWRSARSDEGPLLRPEFHKPRARVSYSFRDVMALRTFVYLRGLHVPLQRIRKAVSALREFGEMDHLSAYSLVAVGRDVAWRSSDDEVVDLTRHPGQQVIASMIDILGGFQNTHDREVTPLFRPAPGIQVDPDVRGGFPVIEGTRVPYDLVASLLADGMAPTEVSAFYPSVPPEAAHGALAFARRVTQQRASASAA